MTSTIVCGVDGSRASLAAARLAGAVADASGRAVQHVYAARSAEFAYTIDHARHVRGRLGDALGREVPLHVMPGAPADRLLWRRAGRRCSCSARAPGARW